MLQAYVRAEREREAAISAAAAAASAARGPRDAGPGADSAADASLPQLPPGDRPQVASRQLPEELRSFEAANEALEAGSAAWAEAKAASWAFK